jgi:hypothetical protein
MSFSGKPSGDGFANRYKLHYQLKKVGADRGDKYQQSSCINYHGRRDSRVKLTSVIKNKWSFGWMKAWFTARCLDTCVSKVGKQCISYARTCVAWSFGRSPPLTLLTMTRGTLPLSR